jgi:hypothetical protein
LNQKQKKEEQPLKQFQNKAIDNLEADIDFNGDECK